MKILWSAYGLLFSSIVAFYRRLGFDQRYPQLAGRRLSAAQLGELRQARMAQPDNPSYVFFASSAGEYEQALPIIEEIERRQPASLCVIVIFSESGLKFASTQSESRPLIKAPWDCTQDWRRLFQVLQPQHVFVIRYELWPGFLAVASSYCDVSLVNASLSRKGSLLNTTVKGYFLRRMAAIFLVAAADRDYFVTTYGIDSRRLIAAGDTKYERVVRRVATFAARRLQLSSQLSQRWPQRRRVIVGSAWPADLDLFTAALRSFIGWQWVIAPHDVSPAMLKTMLQFCQAAGLKVCRYSQLAGLDDSCNVLLIDQIGILPELYSLADLAFVGGASHFRVHNVLEPAVRGRPLAFGPHFGTSAEARELVSQGLAAVVSDGLGLMRWLGHWSTTVEYDSAGLLVDRKLQQYVQSKSGAASKIVTHCITRSASQCSHGVTR